MSSLWDSFTVYNRHKHSSDPELLGTNHSNIGTGKTSVLFPAEHRILQEKTIKAQAEAKLRAESEASSRRASYTESLNSNNNANNGDTSATGGAQPMFVDISNMTRSEFKRLYDSMREGEPDNKVNF
ncbi:similar to Saccharomyces cerevisiae YMR107W SPG4 Protein required for survival at high temperature during stationary phase [Maudiozyma barnettii]|uniref:Stationary phase protein 4 n=1 Tax=Maudiozyma barnettii TaxID=61262 RepID=A0A8H2VF95_9SACH|nr:Spg4p [Kazachstania barnettii]CAB4254445.1 similar to Saccharomyces cerevisiae YMR107W SPG4 Protein required for survival at high temperature during stationary phase [Kazachstania barnettii]CAD1782401.1 similar to Saccharomyces cerevisiae YMR107W SPG4 Protein required for survival at high temperature during stationary phase [Kazachstania barnettii]